MFFLQKSTLFVISFADLINALVDSSLTTVLLSFKVLILI